MSAWMRVVKLFFFFLDSKPLAPQDFGLYIVDMSIKVKCKKKKMVLF